ncbi:Golgi transport complex subunit COG7 NDAI_0D03500 [Naumovozyma dairenensis CBS 421]|uniref:Uncharacterized protein n=1 Tax=Naumovozyma dairenensis (strain ATCC 10597 / BCRC 20456 / CBS 421 / NBRC 0211 / NRRL Y-12639) TaxID=1071378 RepID=G0WA53_NAUDC|nr:hypothetical protein NDAI_0D03500 [Naumovozyma dairenensis CBS 421]CCD24664.1 hypothetical protein NDAI_0D03500 [Naumovozyma dairenensis CBS 421]
MSQENKKEASTSQDDELLEMFFDEGFVPQAYIDIFISTLNANKPNQIQTASSALLARLDFYTKYLTKELETTIWDLEKLSEALPATLSSNWPAIEDHDPTSFGASKLEYYIDTLGSAVRGLETDMDKVDSKLDALNSNYEKNSNNLMQKLKGLETIKSRLNNVLQTFNELKIILDISSDEKDKDVNRRKIATTSLDDFTISLRTLEDTIISALNESLDSEKSNEINDELLKRIDQLNDLLPLFNGFDKFNTVYSQFSTNIKHGVKEYLSTKDIDAELGS